MVIQGSACSFAMRRSGRSLPPSGLAGPAWCAARDGQLRGWFGVCRPSVNRTLAPPEEAEVPGVSLTGSRLYRQTEVLAIGVIMETVAAIVIAAGAAVLVILAIIFVVGMGWYISSSL